MAQQGGVITTAQAMQAGLSGDDIQRLLRTGQWVALRKGHYVLAEHLATLDPYLGRPRLEARAAWMAVEKEHAISHDSAAAFLEIPTLRQVEPLIHLTRLGPPRARVRDGVKRHQSLVLLPHLQEIDGVVVLDPARTAIDIAREHGLAPGVVAIDGVRRQGVGLAELWAALEPMRHWPDVTTARAAVAASDPRAESAGESLMRLLVEELGIGPIQPQFELRDGVRWARCDLRVGRHLFEFDGRRKYERSSEGGLARDPARALWDEKTRQDWLLGYQLGMSRLIWADFWGDRRRQALERVAREFALTCARFGTSIDDLAHLIVHRAALKRLGALTPGSTSAHEQRHPDVREGEDEEDPEEAVRDARLAEVGHHQDQDDQADGELDRDLGVVDLVVTGLEDTDEEQAREEGGADAVAHQAVDVLLGATYLDQEPREQGQDAPDVQHQQHHVGDVHESDDHRRRRSEAHFVSSWREESCSLRSTEDMWVSTVLMEMKSSFATSL
jgi:hypothetical protein